MSDYLTFNAIGRRSTIARRIHDTIAGLASIAEQHPGRVVFATHFSVADQVIAHLIFKHRLPIRVFAFDGQVSDDMLLRSVDYFKASIEVFTRQSHAAAAAFIACHPDVLSIYKQNPACAPLSYILSETHLLVSAAQNMPAGDDARKKAEAAANLQRRTIHNPLSGWSVSQIMAYALAHGIPLMPSPADVRVAAGPQGWWHRLFRQVRTSWQQKSLPAILPMPQKWPESATARPEPVLLS